MDHALFGSAHDRRTGAVYSEKEKVKKFVWAAAILAVLFFYSGAAYYFSGEITTFRVKSQEDILKEDSLRGYADVKLPRPEEVRIPVNDVVISGWLFMNPKNRKCGVLLHHGHGSNRAGSLQYAPLFWPRGCHLFLFDARHHGASTGVFATWGHREKHDLVAMVDWFSKKTGLARENVGIFGTSMGAAIVMQAAPLLPDIAFAAADSPFQDLDSILRYRGARMYGKPLLLLYPAAAWLAGLRGNFETDEVSPIESAHNVTIPVFMTHAKDDADVPFSHGSAVFEAIPGTRKVFHPVDTGGHCKLMKNQPALYRKWMDAFLKEHVPDFG
jgi:dipeptidyl aminopeptidase/acylaminoacyl peptidase